MCDMGEMGGREKNTPEAAVRVAFAAAGNVAVAAMLGAWDRRKHWRQWWR